MMNLYLNFKQVFKHLLPYRIQNQRLVDWMGALFAPIQSLNIVFVQLSNSIRYDFRFTGQVVYLERLLNEAFDPSNEGIYISDPIGQQIFTPFVFNRIEQQPPLYIYNVADAKPILANIVLYNEAELVVNTDFVVFVPSPLFSINNTKAMQILIEKYRIAGKRYIFQSY
jgi:hypothetical protein